MKNFLLRPIFGPADWVMSIVAVIVLAGALAWMMVDVRDYITVQSQTVAERDGVLYVDVSRTIYRPFIGGYQIIIWSESDGSRFCDTGHMGPTPYRLYQEDGTPSALPDPMTLSFWAEGGTCDVRWKKPVPAGRYTMLTCHSVERPVWFVPARKTECWPVVKFTVEGPARAK